MIIDKQFVKVIGMLTFMFFMVLSCDDDIDINRPISTKTEGYYQVPTNQSDVDLMFLKMGIRDTSVYQDRWCAIVGDTLVVLTGRYLSGDTRHIVHTFVFVNGMEIIRDGDTFPTKTVERLIPDKPVFVCNNCTVIPMRTGETEKIITFGEGISSCVHDAIFDKIWSKEHNLLIYHDSKGNYFVDRCLVGGGDPFLPEYIDFACSGMQFGYWGAFGGNMDFEEDGTIEINFVNVRFPKADSGLTVHLTHEAIQELEANNGKISKKYWKVSKDADNQDIYEFVIEYPNGADYKISIYNRVNGYIFNDVSVSYRGNSYSTKTDYSTLPCRFTTSYRDLWRESKKDGVFVEVSLDETLEKLLFKDANSTMTYQVERDFDYLVGQNNSLIIGKSNFLYRVNDFPAASGWLLFNGLFIYDGVCPNCIASKQKLDIQFDEGIVTCGKCSRRYDLNNYGRIVWGKEGKPLIRYPATYNESASRVEIMNG